MRRPPKREQRATSGSPPRRRLPQPQPQPPPREIPDIERIRNMLNSPGSTIEMLTCGSAKGFMFEMTVDPTHSEFSNHGGERITSFIVKLAVTSQQTDEELDDYVPVNRGTPVGKSTETADSYFQEAKIQQDVWMTTIAGTRLPISPPIVLFSLFDNENGKNFLTFLNYKVKKHKSVHTIKYLRRVLRNLDYGLGMIIMSKVLDSDTFESFLDLPRNRQASFQDVQVTEDLIHNVYAKLISKIVRLYIEVGVIHFDLHLKNALIYRKADSSLDVSVIDYGRASDVNDNTTNDYLGPAEKRPLRENSKALHTELLKLCHPTKHAPPTPQDKINFISHVIDPLRRLEHERSQQLYGNSESYPYGRYQFDWMEEITPMLAQMTTRRTAQATREIFNDIAVMAFDNLFREITVDIDRGAHLSRATLQQNCVNFKNRTPVYFQTHFLATWTELANSILPRIGRRLTSFFSRQGGRGKKRKTNIRRTRKLHKLHKLHKINRKYCT
jgi:hypothetical protein